MIANAGVDLRARCLRSERERVGPQFHRAEGERSLARGLIALRWEDRDVERRVVGPRPQDTVIEVEAVHLGTHDVPVHLLAERASRSGRCAARRLAYGGEFALLRRHGRLGVVGHAVDEQRASGTHASRRRARRDPRSANRTRASRRRNPRRRRPSARTPTRGALIVGTSCSSSRYARRRGRKPFLPEDHVQQQRQRHHDAAEDLRAPVDPHVHRGVHRQFDRLRHRPQEGDDAEHGEHHREADRHPVEEGDLRRGVPSASRRASGSGSGRRCRTRAARGARAGRTGRSPGCRAR